MGTAVQKVKDHLRRVGKTRWHVRAYERDTSWPTKAPSGSPESEVERLIRKAQKSQGR